jgi:hypothetical protein
MGGGKEVQVLGVDKILKKCGPHPKVRRSFFENLDAAMTCASIRRAIH